MEQTQKTADIHQYECLKGHRIDRLPLPLPAENTNEPFFCDACKQIYLRYHDGLVEEAPKDRLMF